MNSDAAWAAAEPRVSRADAERMIGTYAAYLMRAIRCLPPSERAEAVADVTDLMIGEFGRQP